MPPRTLAAPRRPVRKTDKDKPKQEPKILFQQFFKSVGPRTYAAQLKEAGNGNHFLVLTEGKRDEATGEVKKIRLFVFSEDFREFFHMLHETAQFIKANPVPEEVRHRRERHWAKKGDSANGGGAPASRSPDRKPQPISTGKKR